MEHQDYLIPPAEYLFMVAPRTPLCEFLEEARKLVGLFPEILEAIHRDLERYALEKKKLRVADKAWTQQSAPLLPGCSLPNSSQLLSTLTLQKGRPRMDPRIVYLFMMVRGFAGGVKGLDARNLFMESLSVELILREAGIKRPGLSTIIENTNAVSQETRDLILDCQLKMFLDEEKDDYRRQIVDSTAVQARSAWPTDSSLILGYISRIWHRGCQFHRFGIPNFSSQEIPEILQILKTLDFQISNAKRRKGADSKRRSLYQEVIDLAEVASQELAEQYRRAHEEIQKKRLKPSLMAKLERLHQWIQNDLEALDQLIAACIKRVIEGKPPSSGERPLSLSDPDAAFIQKGSQDPVFGYRVQLAKSGNGFVSHYIVPKGNAADAPQLLPLCKGAMKRTGVIPEIISADGGYAGRTTRNSLLGEGVSKVSISSSKGKSITPCEDWESQAYKAARRGRSAVESLVFQLKNVVRLDQMVRRGIEKVRAEICEKIIAFNFLRSCHLNAR